MALPSFNAPMIGPISSPRPGGGEYVFSTDMFPNTECYSITLFQRQQSWRIVALITAQIKHLVLPPPSYIIYSDHVMISGGMSAVKGI